MIKKPDAANAIVERCESLLVFFDNDLPDLDRFAKYHGVSNEMMLAMLEVGRIAKFEKIQARYDSENKSIQFLESE